MGRAELTDEQRAQVRWFLQGVQIGRIGTEADLAERERAYARLALRHGYADDGTAGLPFYRVTPKGERFLQEFER